MKRRSSSSSSSSRQRVQTTYSPPAEEKESSKLEKYAYPSASVEIPSSSSSSSSSSKTTTKATSSKTTATTATASSSTKKAKRQHVDVSYDEEEEDPKQAINVSGRNKATKTTVDKDELKKQNNSLPISSSSSYFLPPVITASATLGAGGSATSSHNSATPYAPMRYPTLVGDGWPSTTTTSSSNTSSSTSACIDEKDIKPTTPSEFPSPGRRGRDAVVPTMGTPIGDGWPSSPRNAIKASPTSSSSSSSTVLFPPSSTTSTSSTTPIALLTLEETLAFGNEAIPFLAGALNAFNHSVVSENGSKGACSSSSSGSSSAASTQSSSSSSSKTVRAAPTTTSSGGGGGGGKKKSSAIQPAAKWQLQLQNILFMRSTRDAPVDTMGCERCADQTAEPRIQRFQTLISLMLSAQTKDEITFAATRRLIANKMASPEVLSETAEEEIDKVIYPVGFHRNKAKYIRATSQAIMKDWNGDVPDTIEGLCSLHGVGPKMAFITLNVAWGKAIGIGVDTHVHRIANRLGWVKTTDPEQSRMDLQSWMPEEYWSGINILLVGFGQQVCTPVAPRCDVCLNKSICSVGMGRKDPQVGRK